MKKKIEMPQPICLCLNEGDEPVEMDISEPVWDWMQQVTDAINGEGEKIVVEPSKLCTCQLYLRPGELPNYCSQHSVSDLVSLEKVKELVKQTKVPAGLLRANFNTYQEGMKYNQALDNVLEKLEKLC